MRNYILWLSKLLTLLVIFLFVLPVGFVILLGILINLSDDGSESRSKNVVAVIKLDGMIDDSREVIGELHKQIANEKVKGIVLRINSPGGAVGPSQDIYAAVKRLKAKKPIVASMGSVAASGGFYAALGASKIFCQPGTITGSIGVILNLPNVRRVADWAGVEMITVKSGALKDVGNAFREMAPEEREFLQGTVSTVHEEFVRAVAEGRSLDRQKVAQFADGRIIIGSQAKDLKLVDGFGDVYDAARAVFDVLGKPLPEGEYPKLHYVEDRLASVRRVLESVIKIPASMIAPGFQLRYAIY